MCLCVGKLGEASGKIKYRQENATVKFSMPGKAGNERTLNVCMQK